MAFAWISPGRGTGWVTVRQKGYVEAYRTVGRLPVRIASAGGVSIETARATFRVTEHDARGSLLREYELHAAVAG